MKPQTFHLSAVMALGASLAFPCGNANCPLVTQSQDSVKSQGVRSLWPPGSPAPPRDASVSPRNSAST